MSDEAGINERVSIPKALLAVIPVPIAPSSEVLTNSLLVKFMLLVVYDYSMQ
jgi:hypothetical protein